MLHRDPGVARERAELAQAVDRVGRAVPPVGVLPHHRHGETRPRATDVQRRAWQLPGTGPADRAVQLMDCAVMVEWLSREHQVEDLDRLAHARGARARRAGTDPVGLELALDRAPSEPELEPAFREDVDRRRHLGQDRRVTERIAGDEVADADRGGAHRERGGERPPFERVLLGAAGAARWSISQTESNPAASAASVRSRIVANDIRSCGRNNPNHGAAGASPPRQACPMSRSSLPSSRSMSPRVAFSSAR